MHIRKEMPLLKKLGLWVLGVVVVFSLLVWSVTSSHAAMGTDPRIAEVERIWKKFDPDIMLSADGLTQTGYEVFFPGRDASKGIADWRRLTALERLAFLKQNGAPLPRGLWTSQRNDELVAIVRRGNPDITDEGIREVLGTLGTELVRDCLEKKPLEIDQCIFFLGTIADSADIVAAQKQVGWYLWYRANQRKLDAVRRLSVPAPAPMER